MKQKRVLHYPSLKTILMIEKALKAANAPLTREALKQRLRTKVMHQTLNIVLAYLEESGKILDGRKGILWIFNPSEKLSRAIEAGKEL